MYFLTDQLFDGRQIRVLAIVNHFTRLSPALDVRHSYKGSDVVDTLERKAADYGHKRRGRADNGPEFISKDLDPWADQHHVTLDFSRPSKPANNAFVGPYNGCVRAKCPNVNWFLSQADAQAKCEARRRSYNEVHLRGSLGNQTPMERAFASRQAYLP